MLNLHYTPAFENDLKSAKKKHRDIDKLEYVVKELLTGNPLNGKYHDHALTGDYSGRRELHVGQNFLLVYQIMGNDLYLARLGSHDDLFK